MQTTPEKMQPSQLHAHRSEGMRDLRWLTTADHPQTDQRQSSKLYSIMQLLPLLTFERLYTLRMYGSDSGGLERLLQATTSVNLCHKPNIIPSRDRALSFHTLCGLDPRIKKGMEDNVTRDPLGEEAIFHDGTNVEKLTHIEGETKRTASKDNK